MTVHIGYRFLRVKPQNNMSLLTPTPISVKYIDSLNVSHASVFLSSIAMVELSSYGYCTEQKQKIHTKTRPQ
jgi:hypothetical protein